MLQRSFIAVLVLVVLLVGGAIGAYAYDSSREQVIAEGITAAGIDLGGMRPAEARAALQERVSEPLSRPITIRRGGRRWRLTPKQARLRADVAGTVAEALERSREGNVISRTWRDLTGAEVAAALEPRVTYSRRAVRKLVRRIKRAIDRPAVDATLSYSGSGISTTAGQTGRRLRDRVLARAIGRQIVLPNGRRKLRARVATIKPEVTEDELAQRYPTALVVDRSSFRLRLYKNLQLAKTYTVAIGAVGYDTPTGLYSIQNKAVNPDWNVPDKKWAGDLAGTIVPGGTPENPLKARWLGIYNGAGIHGTDAVSSLGSRASHGCVRMSIPDVIELYEQVPIGAPVYIS